jgi:hypothetical protein
VCFVVRKTTSELECAILTTLYLAGAKNTYSCYARKGNLQRAFTLYVLMVPSSVLTVATDSDRLMCGGTLNETIRLGSFKFIADYFSGLSLSPRRGDSEPDFMGSTHSGTPSPWRVMIEDSVEEFLIESSGEGGSDLPSPRRSGTVLRQLPLQPPHGWRMLRPLRQ